MKLFKSLFILLLSITNGCQSNTSMPDDFVYLSSVDPTIIESVRYATDNNFIGRPIEGYTSKQTMCTKQAAEQLKKVHDDLKKQGYTLVVYDAYRPQRAVNEFISWSEHPQDQLAKAQYYPTTDKKDVFKLGYVSKKSGHTRGSTFDLTIIPTNQTLKPIVIGEKQLKNGEEIPFLDDNTVDMGSSFDLFHEVSRLESPLITQEQQAMRQLLRDTMQRHGFEEYSEEWWHYTLKDEPYPNTYFDFVVQKKQ